MQFNSDLFGYLLNYYGFYLFFFISAIPFFMLRNSSMTYKGSRLTDFDKTICSVFVLLILGTVSLCLAKLKYGSHRYAIIAFQIIFSGLSGFLLAKLYSYVFLFVKNLVYSTKIKDNRYGLFAFFILAFKLILSCPLSLNKWSAWSYVVNYSIGFGSRFFIGSILHLFFPNYVFHSIAYCFYLVFSILLIAIVSYFVNCVIKTADPTNRPGLLFLIGCFLCCPASISSMFNENFGKLDLYILLVSLCAVLCFIKIKSVVYKYITLALLGCLCNLIYHGFIFMYFPLFIIVMIYDLLDNDILNTTKLFLSICVVLVIGASFLIMQFCSSVIFENADEMAAAMSSRTNLPINVDALDYEYFKSIMTSYFNFVPHYIAYYHPRAQFLLVVIFMLPIVITFAQLFKNAFNNSKSAIYKNPLFYGLLSILFIIPQFVFNVDWGRWITPIVINSFFIILYYAFKKDRAMLNSINKLSGFVKAHPALSVCAIIFLMLFDDLSAEVFSSDAANIIDKFYFIIGRIF